MTVKQLAILALVAEKSSYGYELERKIKQKNVRLWVSIGFSSIYYLLKKLEEKHYISSTIEKNAALPSKILYSITLSGRQALQQELLKILSSHHRYHHPFDIALFHLHLLHKQDIQQALTEHLNQLRKRKTLLQQQITLLQEDITSLTTLALYERAIALVIAEELWVQNFIQQTQEL